MLVLAVWLWWYASLKSQGTIVVQTPPEPSVDQKKEETKTYNGKYVTFSYPDGFTEKTFDTPVKDPMVERLFLARSDVEGEKIALVVQALSGSPLTEYSAYRLREMRSDEYSEEKIRKDGLNITLFSKTTPVHEVGAFFEQAGMAVSLVVSSPTSIEGLRDALMTIVESLRWQGE